LAWVQRHHCGHNDFESSRTDLLSRRVVRMPTGPVWNDGPVTGPCGECGFTYDRVQLAAAAGDSIRAGAAEAVALLRHNGDEVRVRARPDVWSALEYGCHLRDMLLVQRERVLAARRVNGADCVSMGREERAEHDGYTNRTPVEVARQIDYAATLFSNVLARLSADDWDRTVVYHYPETSKRSLRWVPVHTAHELPHHLLHIRRQL
jgi:hypothetical protein